MSNDLSWRITRFITWLRPNYPNPRRTHPRDRRPRNANASPAPNAPAQVAFPTDIVFEHDFILLGTIHFSHSGTSDMDGSDLVATNDGMARHDYSVL
jgi:hypothetical protein